MTPLRWHVETLRADASPGFTSAGQDRVESRVRGNRVSVALLDATIDDALRTRALPSPSCAARLIELARLPSGRLRDDISAALLHPTVAFPAKARATFTTSHHTGCKSGAAVL